MTNQEQTIVNTYKMISSTDYGFVILDKDTAIAVKRIVTFYPYEDNSTAVQYELINGGYVVIIQQPFYIVSMAIQQTCRRSQV